VTAGGCRNSTGQIFDPRYTITQNKHAWIWRLNIWIRLYLLFSETFHLNPQMLIALADRQEVVISISQHSILEPKVIGFSAYNLVNSSSGDQIQLQQQPLKYIACSKDFFKRNKSLFNSEYTNSRQVSARLLLDAGHYVILPTTFEASQESSFTLRVYSPKLFKLRTLDTPSALVKPVLAKVTFIILLIVYILYMTVKCLFPNRRSSLWMEVRSVSTKQFFYN
jgi:hypothetical protein